MKTISVIFLMLLLVGCTSAAKRAAKSRNRAISVGVHRIGQAIDAGRVDVAREVTRELQKIVPPPAKATPLPGLKDSKAKTIVVLPADSEFSPQSLVLQQGSPEFLAAVRLSPANTGAQEAVESASIQFRRQVADAQRETLKAATEAARPRSFRLLGWISGFGIVGTIVLLIAFPALIPVFVAFIRAVAGWLRQIVENIRKS